MADVGVEIADHVAVVEIRRGPNNHFDLPLIRAVGDLLDDLAAGTDARAIVLCSEGKNFCAGADFAGGRPNDADFGEMYRQACRLFACPLPIVAAVQGAAVGGGLGLACAADFRIAAEDSSFIANFSRLGLHHGFGLTVTLPRIVGQQVAAEMLLSSRRLRGAEALAAGLVDRLVAEDGARPAAVAFARDLAEAAPLAVRAIRATLRRGLLDDVVAATTAEAAEQRRLAATEDFAEGISAMASRRAPVFTSR